ncbi:MAG: NAD(P)-dependent oxidoreductase [Candidatus Symbiothrix sp.]|nr:NAD(P)-dependent oxidoreductase [Candidatus Symbiothrix sp.]
MKVLITGASGFIGSFLVEQALSEGLETWAGVRKSSSKDYLQDVRIRFIDLHFADKERLKQQITAHVAEHGIWDYVIHNAGVTKCLNPDDFERVNYLYTKHFIEALQETGNVPKKFLLMSSLSAHKDGLQTAYGDSKLKAEAFLNAQTDFPHLIFCPTGVYGPREKDYFLMLKTIKNGLDVVAGFEPQQLTFIYVKDLAKAAFLALQSSHTNGVGARGTGLDGGEMSQGGGEPRPYNITDGHVYLDDEYTAVAKNALGQKYTLKIRVPLAVLKTVCQIAENVAKLTKKPATLNSDKYKIMAQRDWTCDSSPAETDFGFRPDYDLTRGMAECVAWYKANKWL